MDNILQCMGYLVFNIRHRELMMRSITICAVSLLSTCLAYADQLDVLEMQYSQTCSAQAIAQNSWLIPNCQMMRNMLNNLRNNRNTVGEGGDLPDPPPNSQSGAIGGNLINQRPPTPTPTPQPSYQAPQPAYLPPQQNNAITAPRNTAPSLPQQSSGAQAVNTRGDDGNSGYTSTPIDERTHRPCATQDGVTNETWGPNKENTTLRYFFKNTCKHGMQVDGLMSNGEKLGVTLKEGERDNIVCSGFYNGSKGCRSMESYTVKPTPGP